MLIDGAKARHPDGAATVPAYPYTGTDRHSWFGGMFSHFRNFRISNIQHSKDIDSTIFELLKFQTFKILKFQNFEIVTYQ